MSLMNSALIITAIGMGLVFIAIIALWGMMELMVRVTARFAKEEVPEEDEVGVSGVEADPADAEETVDELAGLKRKVAAVAVALALSQQNESTYSQIPSYTAGTAWHSVSRSGQLNQHANLYERKSRGR
jgi:Na+-transporting methylmalonyl-CoA/oxaloacetate decarboxylase gamma subunit